MNFMNVIFAAQKQVTSLRVTEFSLYCRTHKNSFFLNTEHPDRCVCLGYGLGASSAGSWDSPQAESSKTPKTGEPTLSVLQACDITGGLYLRIPQKAALAQYLLVKSVCARFSSSPRPSLKILVPTVVFFNSGCSCPTPSSARSCCCRRARTWTTELRVSAIETSSRSVTCAPSVYQVSFDPSLTKQM